MSLLEDQYSDSKNFMARVELTRKFKTNPYSGFYGYLTRSSFQTKQGYWRLDVEMDFYGKQT